jgi:hypothetical protein
MFFVNLVQKFKWLAEKNVVREGGLLVFKSGRQKFNFLVLLRGNSDNEAGIAPLSCSSY